MARVLMLSYLPAWPCNSGGRVRVWQLATHLSRRHEVSLVCPPLQGRPEGPVAFEIREMAARGPGQLVDPRVWVAVRQALREVQPDVMLVEYIWQGLQAVVSRLRQKVPLIVDAFDVATVRFQRGGSRFWRLVSLYERFVLKRADRVFAVSQPDRARLVELGAPETRTQVVPNGVDTAAFRPDAGAGQRVRRALDVGDGERMLFFFGTLDYPPNADALRTLVSDIMPQLPSDCRLFVAGRDPGQRIRQRYEGDRIVFLGTVDPLPGYLNAADAVVVPVRHGSGTRLKILESVACGVPTVATSMAAEGLDLRACGRALTLADDWEEFAAAVRLAVADGHHVPPAAFAETYDWGEIVERVELS